MSGLFLAFHRENLPNERACIAPTFRIWSVENATLPYRASRNLPAHCTFLWQSFSNEPATVMVRVGLAEVRSLADPVTQKRSAAHSFAGQIGAVRGNARIGFQRKNVTC